MSQNCQFDESIQQDFVNNIYPQLIDFLENNNDLNDCFLKNYTYEKEGFTAEVFNINNNYVIKFTRIKMLKEKYEYIQKNNICLKLCPTYIISLNTKHKASSMFNQKLNNENAFQDRITEYFHEMIFQPYMGSNLDKKIKDLNKIRGVNLNNICLDITNVFNMVINEDYGLVFIDW